VLEADGDQRHDDADGDAERQLSGDGPDREGLIGDDLNEDHDDG
jgi:hypothetical protein